MSALTFNAARHSYKLDGRPVKGVTTLLNIGLPKPGLPYWSAKCVAEYVADKPAEVLALLGYNHDSGSFQSDRWDVINTLKGVPWEKRDEAAVRGTDVHAIAEQVVNGNEVEVPEHLAGHVNGFVELIDTLKLRPILTERKVLSRNHWYAGTFDLIAEVDGETLLLDLKTSKAIYGNVAAQCAAYAYADAYLDADDNEQPLPKIDGIGAIHVTENGSKLIRFPDMEHAWRIFLHVAWLAKQLPTMNEWGGSV